VSHLQKGTLLLFGGLALVLAAPSCSGPGSDDDATQECKRGAKGCECKSDDTCNAGLTCDAKGRCVTGSGDGGSAGSSAGSSNGNAGTGSGARAGSGGSAATGGSATGGTAGDGESGAGGSGGTGNTSGQGGEAAGSSESGAPGNGGSGGSGNAGGKAGSGNAGHGGYGASAGMAGSGTAGSPPCTPLTIGGVSIDLNSAPDIASYSADISPEIGGSSPDLMILSFFATYNGVPVGGDDTGTFELGTGVDENYETCARCLDLHEDSSAKFYFASAGTLTLESGSKQMYGYPQGTLRDVTLREATYDPSTFHSTFVPGGACYTVANADFMVDFEPPAPGWICEASYYQDNSDCDCGCGAPDPDCANASYAACDYCYCGDDDGYCAGSTVNSTQNHLCN
jgi:hypothetical protein